TLTGLLGLPEPATPFTTDIYLRGHLRTSVFEKGRKTPTPAFAPETIGQLPEKPEKPTAMATPDVAEPTLVAASHNTMDPDDCGCKRN
ncbi:hypothetical protein LCGC14_3168290, partial [marine sediment metagenome]